MEQTFTNVYKTNVWGNDNNNEYSGSSGSGGEISYNIDTYIPFFEKIYS